MTVPELLALGLSIPALDTPPQSVSPGTRDAITGAPLDVGYPVESLVASTTNEMLDCFKGGVHGWVSDATARTFKSANPRTGNPTAKSTVAFADGASWQPLIAAKAAAEQGRPCWSRLVRDLWPARRGETCVLILTTNTKRRLWPFARAGQLGSRTPLFYFDSETHGAATLYLDWPRLLAALERVEAAYALGFAKASIRECLYASPAARVLGLPETRRLEAALAPWRGSPEFRVAALIAQKTEDLACLP